MVGFNQLKTYGEKLKDFIDRRTTPPDLTIDDGIRYWQERLLLIFLFIATFLGFFAYVPSVALSIKENFWAVAIADTIIYSWLVILFLRPSILFTVRAISVSLAGYFLGMVLLLTIGPFGGGPVWLFAFPVIVALILGFRLSLFALALNTITVIVFSLLFKFGHIEWNYPKTYPVELWTEIWVVVALNFLLLNSIVTISVAFISEGMQNLLKRQKSVLVSLEEEIIERKLVAQALRESDGKYRTLYNMGPDALAVIDIETGDMIDVNKTFIARYGYSRDEILRMKNTDFSVEPEKTKQANRAPGIHIPIRYHRKKDGTVFPTEIAASKFKYQGKSVLIVALRDITERRQAEEALEGSEAHLQSVFRAAPTGIGVVVDRVLKQVNERICEMTGYSEGELVGQSSRIFYQSDNEYERVGREKYEQISKHGTGTIATQWKHKDGRIIDVLLSSTPIDFSDLLGGVTFTALDITERKLAEEELRFNQKLLRDVMDIVPLFICAKDPDGKFILVNQKLAEFYGTTVDEMAGMLHADICEDDQELQAMLAADRKVISNGEIIHIPEETMENPDGSITVLETHKIPFATNDGPAVLIVAFDITDRKNAENEREQLEIRLQQSQKMESIGTLAGGIAHDFNNILFPIVGHTEMLLDDIPQESPLRNSLDEVYAGSLRARDLVKQILTFSRQTEHEIKPLKVQLVIKEALKLIRSSLPATISTHHDISNECGLVMADPTQIHQIAMNLCTNAFHAMEETGGKLIVSLKEVELAVEDLKDSAMIPGPHVCLTVADTGTGIEKNVKDRMFDPYFTTKDEGKGTGLGLAVIHGIIKNHGGHISVYSEPGKGAEFEVYLPVIKSQKTAQQIDIDLPIQKGTERILLVDDQNAIVQMIRQMLGRMGYHATVRTSSPDALEAFRTQPDKFDLVITDMTMPNMTGDKLAEEMIKIRSDIPVILCTGFSERMPEEKATFLGIKGFLMKPVVMKDLSEKIREVLDNKERTD